MASVLASGVRSNMDSVQRALGSSDEQARESVSVLASLSGPIAGGILGWYTSYVIGQKLEGRELVRRDMHGTVLPEAGLTSWIFSGLAVSSIIASATLRALNDGINALFVGQWAPTFVGLGLLARVFGHTSLITGGPIEPISWALVGAGLGSIFASVAMHLRKERTDGLFVGQWAPTLVSAGILTRLYGEIRNR